jgi:DNA-directed RNA polymerase subunit N (RpoN/RPB10)
MSFFKKLSSFFSSKSGAPVGWVTVKCNRCGEVIRARVNLYHDLSMEYDEDGKTTFFCRKVLIGEKQCFQRIEVRLTYDANRKLHSREITGGQFVEG